LPARDEAALIGDTLAALVGQRGIDGEPLPHGFFDIVVFANNCRDETAAVARRMAARTPNVRILTIEERLPAALAHVGGARKRVLDLAATRLLAAGRPDGCIASIDSDTRANVDWIAWIAREMRGRDAVAGHVTIAPADQERLLAPVRLLYAREIAYRRILAEVEARLDPRPEDPLPRHGSFVGAGFAVTAAAYVAAGGLPALARLEDLAFARALERIDARVRHSPDVRATTSARLGARVTGGFGSFLAELHDCARRGTSFTVENAVRTIEDLEGRAALRRLRMGDARPNDGERVSQIFNLAPAEWLPEIDPALPLGYAYERITQRARSRREPLAPMRVEHAIDLLRAAAIKAKSSGLQTCAGDDDAEQSLDAG
jgi:hypothetical protein